MGDWQGYIDNSLIGSGHMHSACLIGNDGSYWAYGGSSVPQPDEAKHIISAIKSPDLARASGITIAGQKYFTLRAEPGIIYFKKGGGGGCIAASTQGVVVGIYGAVDEASLTASDSHGGVNPANCNMTVENIANYLKQSQY